MPRFGKYCHHAHGNIKDYMLQVSSFLLANKIREINDSRTLLQIMHKVFDISFTIFSTIFSCEGSSRFHFVSPLVSSLASSLVPQLVRSLVRQFVRQLLFFDIHIPHLTLLVGLRDFLKFFSSYFFDSQMLVDRGVHLRLGGPTHPRHEIESGTQKKFEMWHLDFFAFFFQLFFLHFFF